jgi:hypothetical protein
VGIVHAPWPARARPDHVRCGERRDHPAVVALTPDIPGQGRARASAGSTGSGPAAYIGTPWPGTAAKREAPGRSAERCMRLPRDEFLAHRPSALPSRACQFRSPALNAGAQLPCPRSRRIRTVSIRRHSGKSCTAGRSGKIANLLHRTAVVQVPSLDTHLVAATSGKGPLVPRRVPSGASRSRTAGRG